MVYVNIAVGCAVAISIGFCILAICSLCDLALSIRYAKLHAADADTEESESDKGEDGVC